MGKIRILGTSGGNPGQQHIRILGSSGSSVSPDGHIRILGSHGFNGGVTAKIRILGSEGQASGPGGHIRMLGSYGYVFVPTTVTISPTTFPTLEPGEMVTLTTNAPSPLWEIIGGSGELIPNGQTCVVRSGANTGAVAATVTTVRVTDLLGGDTESITLSAWPVDRYIVAADRSIKPLVNYINV